ncbi:hypothetical protein [Streptomyces sp. NPDC006552]|uniref:hypothetical protein n=1 Tax=Streptomyces sp. NPDC006552 TaxID=3157179 RepID=UPI0033BD4B6B
MTFSSHRTKVGVRHSPRGRRGVPRRRDQEGARHIGEHLHTGPALALAGGIALFLAGDVAFRAVMRLFPVRFRALAVPVVLATALLGIHVSAPAQLLALVLILVAMLAVKARRERAAQEPSGGSRRDAA